MPRTSFSEQFIRTLKFLLATLDPCIFYLLTLRGFSKDIRREGWDLFHKAGARR